MSFVVAQLENRKTEELGSSPENEYQDYIMIAWAAWKNKYFRKIRFLTEVDSIFAILISLMDSAAIFWNIMNINKTLDYIYLSKWRLVLPHTALSSIKHLSNWMIDKWHYRWNY